MHFDSTRSIRPTRWGGAALGLAMLLLGLQPAAAATYAEAKNAYLAGNYQQALRDLQPLAQQGNTQAQLLLSTMYSRGEGVPQDEGQAVAWLAKAAEQGVPAAQHDLALRYFRGEGVQQSHQQARNWWERSSQAGLPDSQFNLGLMYYNGAPGIPRDYQRARGLFTSAAEREHDHAQYSLAVMFARGEGVQKDYDQARQWFQKSANKGVSHAQYNLGVLYEKGLGLRQDFAEARRWYRLAAAQGLENAATRLQQLETSGSSAGFTPAPVPQQAFNAPVPSPRPSPIRQQPAGQQGLDVVHREDWLRQQAPTAYTLQVVSVLQETDVVNFIGKYAWQGDIAYVKVLIKGQPRYNAIYGVYPSRSAAQQAVASLPAALQKNNPWPRRVSELQGLLTP